MTVPTLRTVVDLFMTLSLLIGFHLAALVDWRVRTAGAEMLALTHDPLVHRSTGGDHCLAAVTPSTTAPAVDSGENLSKVVARLAAMYPSTTSSRDVDGPVHALGSSPRVSFDQPLAERIPSGRGSSPSDRSHSSLRHQRDLATSKYERAASSTVMIHADQQTRQRDEPDGINEGPGIGHIPSTRELQS